MKIQFGTSLWMLIMIAVLTISCKDDDKNPVLQERVYPMASVSNPMISGEIIFTKQNETTTLVVIDLSGTTAGEMHPAHIHANSAAMGGSIVIGLNSVDGANGRSETMVTQLNDETAITYEELLNYNGHANVHLSPTAMATLIAQGDIGSNNP